MAKLYAFRVLHVGYHSGCTILGGCGYTRGISSRTHDARSQKNEIDEENSAIQRISNCSQYFKVAPITTLFNCKGG